ncbi:MAG TPA: hypothetical protein VFV19_15610 [Candidatus Polarisedimenticolaceae bacterium]|nr:hypothetical protein [Candidatus Polarisedimenticolaceae bacterium]
MVETVSLPCPSCAVRLEIESDIERFACLSCGSEVTVRHGGGTVSLTLAAANVTRIERGTDPSLAIRRLEGEMLRLRSPLQQHYTEKSNIEALFLFACILTVMGAGLSFIQWWVGGAVVALGGALVLLTWRSRTRLIGLLRSDESAIAQCAAEIQRLRELGRLAS